ncbi:MAG: sigma-70 family RNA polymerase sigma factor [Renibacterium sp.]|nr:sigma-70 family RNA polymerase sigma factor [Renibacterium sp.]
MNSDKERLDGTAERSDEDLISLVRSGDVDAYGVLYQRHHSVALAVARKNSDNRSDAEDAVSEAFSSVLQALQGGKGPVSFFRAYLLSAVTRIAHRRNVAAGKVTATDDAAVLDRESADPDSVLAEFETDAVARAYKTLPERWQAVLWYSDIEGLKPAAVAPLLGLSANGVSALAIRAREGLRKAYLQNHISTAEDDQCAEYSSKLGSFATNTLRRSQRTEVQEHLDGCLRCTAAFLHLKDVGSAMRAAVVPALLGIGFAAWSQLGTAAGLGKGAVLFAGVRSQAVRAAEQVKTMGSGAIAASVSVVAGVSVATVMLVGQGIGLWGSGPEGGPAVGSQSQPGRSGPGLPGAPGNQLGEALPEPGLVSALSTSETEPAPQDSAPGPVPGGSAEATSTRLPTAFVPPAVVPPSLPETPPVSPEVTTPVTPTVDPPGVVSAELTATGLGSRKNVQVAFRVTGSLPLTSAKVVFRLDPKLAQHFGGWNQQPQGWQCTADDSFTASCVAASANRTDLVFSGVVVMHPLSGKAVLSYEFSATNAVPFSGQKSLSLLAGGPLPAEPIDPSNDPGHPVAPIGSGGSGAPAEPAEPAEPTEPTGPAEPAGPAGPAEPTGPAAPAEPVAPAPDGGGGTAASAEGS